jgi:hypothetical protein
MQAGHEVCVAPNSVRAGMKALVSRLIGASISVPASEVPETASLGEGSLFRLYAAEPNEAGTPTWRQPMRAGARGIHMGDMEQFGNPIVGTFENPGIVGSRQYVCLASDLVSWDDVVAIPREEGHDIAYAQTDEDPYWLHDMFAYFGPDADQEIELAKTISTEPTSDFRTWSAVNMPVGD